VAPCVQGLCGETNTVDLVKLECLGSGLDWLCTWRMGLCGETRTFRDCAGKQFDEVAILGCLGWRDDIGLAGGTGDVRGNESRLGFGGKSLVGFTAEETKVTDEFGFFCMARSAIGPSADGRVRTASEYN
jgi:hypothetical protein